MLRRRERIGCLSPVEYLCARTFRMNPMSLNFSRARASFGLSLFVVFLLTSSPAMADTWSWNPFGTKKKQTDSSPLYTSGKSSSSGSWMPDWKMPQWKMPSWKAPKMPWSKNQSRASSYSRNNTSTWQKMSRSTKRWWAKTAEALDPYPEPKSAPTYEDTPKKSTFASWFKKEEPKKIESVNDFLKQDMVGR